jgi:hypothetical protein
VHKLRPGSHRDCRAIDLLIVYRAAGIDINSSLCFDMHCIVRREFLQAFRRGKINKGRNKKHSIWVKSVLFLIVAVGIAMHLSWGQEH